MASGCFAFILKYCSMSGVTLPLLSRGWPPTMVVLLLATGCLFKWAKIERASGYRAFYGNGLFCRLFFLRHGVIPSRRPRVATCQSFCAHPDAFKYAPLLDGFYGVLRTSGMVPARGRRQRRYESLVEADGQDEDLFEKICHAKVAACGVTYPSSWHQ